jgi:hypothetical protein
LAADYSGVMYSSGSPLVPPVMTTFSRWLAEGPCEAAAWVLQRLLRCFRAVNLLYLEFCCCRACLVVWLASKLCWICSISAAAVWYLEQRGSVPRETDLCCQPSHKYVDCYKESSEGSTGHHFSGTQESRSTDQRARLVTVTGYALADFQTCWRHK